MTPFEKVWQWNAEQVIAAVPALGDPESALAAQMMDALAECRSFSKHEDGFLRAFICIRRGNLCGLVVLP